ncbi:alpha/beta-hydrolase family protein [Bacillus subtilis]|uniref:alpha/beta hydrolase n=1 Tax=Pseudochrobactrum asaccharolyticum TaxID=354351 RepID=UPI001F2994EB|nr:alpha/beta-hydrolase family protein [Pseudochrobactrum asaccharolyticum]MCF7644165.1 alpha/beta-hydrolase family protein [Pseudochrobactrum asaccharolyticum]MCF7670596.1 alpha/beta-hydrolase family protein [Bacillus subtilis]
MKPLWLEKFWNSLSLIGMLLGTLFFAASLTPSLVQRPFLIQGVLSGACFAIGYGIGVFLFWLWNYLQLPKLKGRISHAVKIAAMAVTVITAMVFLWHAADGQNSIRSLMELEKVESAHPFKTGLIALITFIILIALARLFQLIYRSSSRWLDRYIPPRLSRFTGFLIAAIIFSMAINGVLFRFGLHVMDSSYRKFDALMEAEVPQPQDPLKSGSAASLVKWDELGRMGRSYVSSGPDAQQISNFTGRPAQNPLRVYVGLRSAETAKERAKLALAEMIRVGAFERSLLLVTIPTGTGWVDEMGIDPVEYLHDGDIASVAVQYSYLASWLSLLVEPGYGSETATALFDEVYDYWTKLPKDTRPKLYLYGLSLGAMNSQLSSELFQVLGDPYQGALWSGPPFTSRLWRSITNNRNEGTPEWLPEFRDGSYARFTNQNNALKLPNSHWGSMRIVYLQYASDPIVFFDPKDFYREPDWMKAPRGPDVSPQLKWYPVVSMLQLAIDLMMATTTPIGHGHVYAPQHYIDAWVEVTNVNWSQADIDRLKEHFIAKLPK